MGYHNTVMTRMVCNALEGLSDIQVNNLQGAQMVLLDQLIGIVATCVGGVVAIVVVVILVYNSC